MKLRLPERKKNGLGSIHNTMLAKKREFFSVQPVTLAISSLAPRRFQASETNI